jgi:hypothetical protein
MPNYKALFCANCQFNIAAQNRCAVLNKKHFNYLKNKDLAMLKPAFNIGLISI